MTEIFEKPAVISPFPGLTLFPLSPVPADSPIYSEVSSLASSLQDLQNRSDFSAIVSQVNDLDASLNRAVDLLEGARQEGYVYQGDLEQIAYNVVSQWQSARPQVAASLQQQAAGMQGQLYSINSMLQSLNASLPYPSTAGPLLQNARSAVAGLLDHISQVENSLRSLYSEIETRVQALNVRLTDIHWAMDQLNGAKFKLSPGEALVMAVAARWDKEGKDDPEGVLYLSSQRLVFERKEKVATKKILFITTASQLVQEVLIDQPLAKLGEVSPDNRGLFGHQDFLLAQFADPGLGLVAFHINGQDSKDWAGLVEKTRSGRIEAERLNISSGLSIADLSRPLTAADVVGLQSQVNALQDEMMLKASRQEIGNLENDVSALPRKLAALRARGYAVEKALEADIAILAAQWERVKANAETTIETQTRPAGRSDDPHSRDAGAAGGHVGRPGCRPPAVYAAQVSPGLRLGSSRRGPLDCCSSVRLIRPRSAIPQRPPGPGELDAGYPVHCLLPVIGHRERRSGCRGAFPASHLGARGRRPVPHRPAPVMGGPGKGLPAKIRCTLAGRVSGVLYRRCPENAGPAGAARSVGGPFWRTGPRRRWLFPAGLAGG